MCACYLIYKFCKFINLEYEMNRQYDRESTSRWVTDDEKKKKANVKYMVPLLVVPIGAIPSADIDVNLISGDTFEDKIASLVSQRTSDLIQVMPVTSRELALLATFPDVMSYDLIVVTGLVGGKYNTVFNSYASNLKKVSVERLPAELARVYEIFSREKEQVADAIDAYSSTNDDTLED